MICLNWVLIETVVSERGVQIIMNLVWIIVIIMTTFTIFSPANPHPGHQHIKIHVPTKIKKIYVTKIIKIPEHHHYIHHKPPEHHHFVIEKKPEPHHVLYEEEPEFKEEDFKDHKYIKLEDDHDFFHHH